MSDSPQSPVIIPARVTEAQLAEALHVGRSRVEEEVASFSAASSGDLLGPEVSLAVADAIGVEATIEVRDLALEALYELEANGDADLSGLSGRAADLVQGVLQQKEELDHAIESTSEHWSVARMPTIDRTILRLGLFELLHERNVPTPVIVSEAVRLANVYSTERSSSFVNGVLATLARNRRV